MREPFIIGGVRIAPGKREHIEIPVARLFTQTMMSLPVVVAHGKKDGPRLWLSAAIHGDELNGTEIIHRVLEAVKPRELRGTLVAVPVVNLFGFLNQSRYLPDRRDLNRSFPGSRTGSLAAQLAYLLLAEVVDHCTHGIDFHTGSNLRINYPQVRGDMNNPEIAAMARAFAPRFVLHAKTLPGSLREAAGKRGTPYLLYEGGEPLRFSRTAIDAGVAGALRTMAMLGMISEAPPAEPSHEFSKSKWLRAGRAGILNLDVRYGDKVVTDQVVGHIREPFGKRKGRIVAHADGYVLGHTTNPLVNRGDAVIHLAIMEGAAD